jgi:serine protease AprX
MKYLIILFVLVFLESSFAQQKYMLYFTDKGTDSNILAKNSPSFNAALNDLSERSIERRKKVMGDDFITYEDLPVRQDYIDILTSNGIEVKRVLKWFNAVSAVIPEGKFNEIKNFSFIKKIEQVRTLKYRNPEVTSVLKKSMQDSAYYGNSFSQLRLSGIPQVHAKGITGKGTLLGVLDTGFRWKTHEALMNADVLDEYDFIFDDPVTENQPGDAPNQHGHGTLVFSVISGFKDSTLIGAAYNAEFLLAKTEDIRSETRVEEDNYAAALQWMENYGVDITSNSLGYSEFDDFSYDYYNMDGRTAISTIAAELAFERGVLTISSAGNEGNSSWFYITAPADGINTIAVGAVDMNNRIAGFSSKGPTYDGRIKPDVVAMGVSVLGASAFSDNAYGMGSGTSLAAPLAAGTASLLLSAFPYLNNLQMRSILLNSADNYKTPDNIRGYGLVSALNAIEYPNIRLRDNGYVLRKAFVQSVPAAVDVYFSTDKVIFTRNTMTRDTLGFTFSIPEYTKSMRLYFYFTDPAQPVTPAEYFTFNYSDLIISKTTAEVDDYIMSQNYPNPFNSSTKIIFNALRISDIEVVIYDVMGQRVRNLFRTSGIKGEFSVIWDGRKDDGSFCSSGVYIYRIRMDTRELSRKMLLIR